MKKVPSETELELLRRKQQLRARSQSTLSGAESLFDIPKAVEADGGLTDAEEDFGLANVPWRVYKRYVAAAGGFLAVFLIFLAFVANVGSTVFSTVWLSEWLEEARHAYTISEFSELTHRDQNDSFGSFTFSERNIADDPEFTLHASVYAACLLLLLATGVLKAMVFVKISLIAASRLHNSMFKQVIKAKSRFFDSTPSGRILNRFSKDMDEVDIKLPFSIESFMQNMFMVLAYLVVIARVFPYFLIGCIPLGAIFFVLVASFRAGIRYLKRSENISRSPLFDHISSSLEGLSTIHAFQQNKRFLHMLRRLLDENSAALFMFHSAMRWLAVWLDLLVVAITTLVALFIVLTAGEVPAAYAGMALTFAIQMSGIFQFAVRSQTEMEAKMTSVERIDYYVESIETEGDWISSDYTPAIGWPQKGRISFREVRLRYRDNIPLALKDVTLDIKPTETVGIVGRTGSGKTSLGFALFRLYPSCAGTVSLDEVDVKRVGVHQLRSRMEAIPQDPQLFAGTVRFNLDPLRRSTDAQLWDALQRVYMRERISGMPNGLDASITESGGNLSSGERQLLCMARALLRNVRVLLLDEATSALDAATDALIQRCLRDAFSHCTLLIIAHRLNSVQNVDRILYMDNGKVLEFDHPKTLLEDPKSYFYKLMSRTQKSQTDTPLYEVENNEHANSN